MKKVIIVLLLCLNAVLLTALVMGSGTPAATAQVVGGGSDYMLMAGKVQSDLDALFVLDLGTRKFKVWKMDKTRWRMAAVGIVDLARDFK